MDNNVVRTLNQGPIGPQGPVKVNNCIMNKEAGFEPVVRIYPHTWPEEEEEEITTGEAGGESIAGGIGGESISGGTDNDEEEEVITGEAGGASIAGGDSTIPGSDNP